MSSTIEEQVYDILIQNYHLRLDHTKDCHKLAREIAADFEDAFEKRHQEGFKAGLNNWKLKTKGDNDAH